MSHPLWPEAAKMAEEFRRRIEADERVSEVFHPVAANAHREIRNLRERFG